MKSIRNVLAGTVLAGGAMIMASAGVISANAEDTSATAASAPGPQGSRAHDWGPEHLYSKLGLTAEQQASIKAIMTTARPEMKSLHEQMHANRLKLMQTSPDDANYANLVAEVAQSNAALASQRTTQGSQLRTQMYAVLTPAQKTQLTTLEAQWAANPHHGAAGHRGPGFGPGAGVPPAE